MSRAGGRPKNELPIVGCLDFHLIVFINFSKHLENFRKNYEISGIYTKVFKNFQKSSTIPPIFSASGHPWISVDQSMDFYHSHNALLARGKYIPVFSGDIEDRAASFEF